MENENRKLRIEDDTKLKASIEKALAKIDNKWYVSTALAISESKNGAKVGVSFFLKREPNDIFEFYYETKPSQYKNLIKKLSNENFYRDILDFYKHNPSIAKTAFVIYEDGHGYFNTVSRGIDLKVIQIRNNTFVGAEKIPAEIATFSNYLFDKKKVRIETL